jgi:hypothetical protein
MDTREAGGGNAQLLGGIWILPTSPAIVAGLMPAGSTAPFPPSALRARGKGRTIAAGAASDQGSWGDWHAKLGDY